MHLALDTVDLARWQFGITTVYHYLFVPLTIGLSTLTACLQTAWVRTGRTAYYRATRFWGKLFLINFAMGVVTGIVQEFQFGMNWSAYSRFVGDIFGAPLAIEALLAFFLESTFLGLWIFGWDRLPRRLHLAAIWCAAVGTILSAYFILAANSWMQHPTGFHIAERSGQPRAELTDFVQVLTQPTALVAFFHTLAAAFLTGGAFVVGIASYHLVRKRHLSVMRPSLRLGLVVLTVSGALTALSGDTAGKLMYEQQPMKMASAEALWETSQPAPFSVFAYGDVEEGRNKVTLEIPGALSFLANNDFRSELPGINQINKAEQHKYGPGDYRPVIPVTYWGFRVMVGFGMVSFGVGAAGLWLTRRKLLLAPAYRGTSPEEPQRLMLTPSRELGPTLTRWGWRVGTLTLAFPLISNSAGWIFTEMGRQPWVVYGVLRTEDAVSPSVSFGSVLTSLLVFTSLYAVLAVIEVRLLLKYGRLGPAMEDPPKEDPVLRGPGNGPGGPEPGGPDADDEPADPESERPLAFAY